MYRILLNDDDETILTAARMYFQDETGYELVTADSRDKALNLINTREFDVIIVDLLFPDVSDGLAVIKNSYSQPYQPSILAMTAFDTVENAVATMQAGADDFIAKRFSLDELISRIENLLKCRKEINALTIDNKIWHQTLQQQFDDCRIVGESTQIKTLVEKVKKVAEDAQVTCLIEGESGTGKELIARTIYSLSNRRYGPFIPINCAAIPDNLLENEFFGHERGAFTGAYYKQRGKFELANNGVLFLDEISELPISLQGSLLRVLEEKEIYRIGGKKSIRINVMILVSSNQNLEQMVYKNSFRKDLYFRLNVIKIKAPPLREHPQDIEPLACYFLDKFNRQRNKKLTIDDSSLSYLKSYIYSGNVRELRNLIENACVFCSGDTIHPSDLQFNQDNDCQFNSDLFENILNGKICGVAYQNAIRQFEKIYFNLLLGRNHGNIKEAARHAGLSREWLSKKISNLKKYS
jgi:two-component system response regulator AtoC